jgi:chaperonin GroES
MLKPLADRIIIEVEKQEEKTASGIVLPDMAKEKPMQGKVIAVGPGRLEDGKRIPVEVKIGDLVLYAKYAGTEVKVDNHEYLILRESDILTTVD